MNNVQKGTVRVGTIKWDSSSQSKESLKDYLKDIAKIDIPVEESSQGDVENNGSGEGSH